jgi:hypothetical protein
MNERDKQFAEAVIRYLCEGGRIDGIRFGPILQILISNGPSSVAVKGQIYLNLAARWLLSSGMPASMPREEDGFPQLEPDQEIAAICAIREQTIRAVTLGSTAPHLFLSLESGQVLCLNGHDDRYEMWQLGVALGDRDETWLIVAGPRDDLVVWAPAHFSGAT